MSSSTCHVFTASQLSRLGISDKFFVLASDAVQMVVMEIVWLPNMLLMSQLCPKGCEATMFALLAGMSILTFSSLTRPSCALQKTCFCLLS